MIACGACGAEMPDYSAFCPACGRGASAPAALGTTRGIPDHLAGALAYVTIIPAIIFLSIEPFKTNRFIRFHSFQSLFFCVAVVVISAVLRVFSLMLTLIPFFGRFISLLIWMILPVACFIIWAVLLIKAFQGEMFKLPMVGDWAERWANAP